MPKKAESRKLVQKITTKGDNQMYKVYILIQFLSEIVTESLAESRLHLVVADYDARTSKKRAIVPIHHGQTIA